jgi:uncharacterized protein (DUF58 family)
MAAPRPHGERAGWLRRDAERISGAVPPLLVEAQRLVSATVPGVHGRRRAGPGETFWQYRPAHPGDTYAAIDWRRSARSDRLFVREMEWEAAETVMLWADRSAAMELRSDSAPRTKAERAALLSLAVGVLLARGDERFGLAGTEAETPASGRTQLMRMAALLSADMPDPPPYGVPPRIALPRIGHVVFISDFLGDEEAILASVRDAAGRGLGGVLLQVLDPEEEAFPYRGRLRFEGAGGGLAHETDEAGSLRRAYLARLAARRDRLDAVARRAGWRFIRHTTGESPRVALLALYNALGGGGIGGRA